MTKRAFGTFGDVMAAHVFHGHERDCLYSISRGWTCVPNCTGDKGNPRAITANTLVESHANESIDLATVPTRSLTGARWIDKDARRLTCNQEGCEAEATTIHLVPNVVDVEHVEAACFAHDPGGYWFNVTELRRNDPMSWLGHLANKRGNGVQALLRWMYPGW